MNNIFELSDITLPLVDAKKQLDIINNVRPKKNKTKVSYSINI